MFSPAFGDPQTLTALLAERARSGDLSRFEELYDRVAPALFSWAALRLGPGLRGRVDPDEIVQETWIRALRDLEQFDAARGSFRAWIFGLAKYVLLDALRLARREDRDEGRMTLSTAALANHPDSVTSATRRLAREEGLQRFLERMQALGEDEQTLVLLCGLEGMSCDQAALRLGISHAAAVKRWQRLRAEILRRDLPRELLVEEAP